MLYSLLYYSNFFGGVFGSKIENFFMGFSEKHQVVDAGGLEFDGKKWVIAGIPLRAPLKPIYTKPVEKDGDFSSGDEFSTTPTGEETRIPARMKCPQAPKKRKASLKFNYSGAREFFTPPDLETVFIRHVERAN